MDTLSLRTPGDIGALIKERRRALGLDQAELAERIGASRLWIIQVERGKPGASLGLVLRALAAVGVDVYGRIDEGASPADWRSDGFSEGPQAPLLDVEPVDAPDIDAIVAAARAGRGQ